MKKEPVDTEAATQFVNRLLAENARYREALELCRSAIHHWSQADGEPITASQRADLTMDLVTACASARAALRG